MGISRTNRVFFIVFIFLGIGITVLFITHNRADFDYRVINADESSSSVESLVNGADYAQNIRPWFESVYNNYSLESIRSVKDNLSAFRSSDRFVGKAHVNLFLAFSAWEQFLLTNNDSFKQEVFHKLEVVSELIPELSEDIRKLQNILK